MRITSTTFDSLSLHGSLHVVEVSLRRSRVQNFCTLFNCCATAKACVHLCKTSSNQEHVHVVSVQSQIEDCFGTLCCLISFGMACEPLINLLLCSNPYFMDPFCSKFFGTMFENNLKRNVTKSLWLHLSKYDNKVKVIFANSQQIIFSVWKCGPDYKNLPSALSFFFSLLQILCLQISLPLSC